MGKFLRNGMGFVSIVAAIACASVAGYKVTHLSSTKHNATAAQDLGNDNSTPVDPVTNSSDLAETNIVTNSTTNSTTNPTSNSTANNLADHSTQADNTVNNNSTNRTNQTTPPPAPPAVSVPQAVPPFASKESVLLAYGQEAGIQPLAGVPSPFDDISTSDPAWGVIAAMLQQHLFTPDSSTHLGAQDVFTLQDTIHLCAHLHPVGVINSYDPGGNDFSWASIVGITSGIKGGYPTESMQALGRNKGLSMTTSDVGQMIQNVQRIRQGYVPLADGYDRLLYPWSDEWTDTFDAGVSVAIPSDGIQSAITKTYETMSDIRVKADGGYLIASLPAFPIDSHYYIGTLDSDYSLDNGQTWQDGLDGFSAGYTSSDSKSGGLPASKLPARVLVRCPADKSMIVMFFDDHINLAAIRIAWGANGPLVTRYAVTKPMHF